MNADTDFTKFKIQLDLNANEYEFARRRFRRLTTECA
jgi:hypothetical protein